MSDPDLGREAERLDLMRKLSDKGIGELVEEICDLKNRLATEARNRRDLLDSVRRLTDEVGELRAKLAFSSGQPTSAVADPKESGSAEAGEEAVKAESAGGGGETEESQSDDILEVPQSELNKILSDMTQEQKQHGGVAVTVKKKTDKAYRGRWRCGKCEGCVTAECGQCVGCLVRILP